MLASVQFAWMETRRVSSTAPIAMELPGVELEAAKKNKKGDKGHPCEIPSCCVCTLDIHPHSFTKNLRDVRHDATERITCAEKNHARLVDGLEHTMSSMSAEYEVNMKSELAKCAAMRREQDVRRAHASDDRTVINLTKDPPPFSHAPATASHRRERGKGRRSSAAVF